MLIEDGRRIEKEEFENRISEIEEALLAALGGEKLSFAIEATHGAETYSRFFALTRLGLPVLPCAPYQFSDPSYRDFLKNETATDYLFWAGSKSLSDALKESRVTGKIHSALLAEMAQGASPLILRTSGTSGSKYKYVLHDYRLFLEKYRHIPIHFDRTLAFSPFDAVSGIETLTEAYCHGRTLICGGDKMSPQWVSSLINQNSIDLFQTTPSFMSLWLISGSVDPEQLRSLRKIAYGSEPAPQPMLTAIRKKLPWVEFMHTYGMTEIGIQRTRTPQEDPSIFALDERYNLGRVRDGLLEVKSMSPLRCYLNSEARAADDGWFRTGDLAEEIGGYLKVLGRADDTINVAGRKFLPIELEELIMNLDNVADAVVIQEKNAIIGNALHLKVTLLNPEDEVRFKTRLKEYCEKQVPNFMHPHRVSVVKEGAASPRFKKVRR
jgi:acyl-coenzyme A synthetase/AMP-(fatty) acid ligase